ncbi:uncharacterized protein LOC128551622 [Mercenaria mercenaria]|uniref:uncharacterized protein LOC128551622 n=1 Tax=Mercenaria mercenaria TaxID=6596 RepID=UPI00234F632D|nr:uncharacterized protein LOC128551622 [Mercenaria mercenaria]
MADKYYRLSCFLIDICPEPLRELFLQTAKSDTKPGVPYTSLDAYLAFRKADILSLKNRRKLRDDQYDLLYPKSGPADESQWDFTLLAVLIFELFKSYIPNHVQYFIRDIRDVRNSLQHVSRTSSISDSMFQKNWDRLEIATLTLAKVVNGTNYENVMKEKIEIAKVSNMPDILQNAHMVKPGPSGKPNKRMKTVDKALKRMQGDDDPRTRKLFEDAIKDGVETDKTIRVMIIGCHNQGKTTLARRLQGQSIEGIESTNGIDIHKCVNTANGIWQKQNTENDEDEKIKRIAKVMLSHSNSDQNDLDIEDDVIGEAVGVTAKENQAQSLEQFRFNKPETMDPIETSVIFQDHKKHQQKEMHGHSVDPFPLQKVLLAMEENDNVEETIHLWDFGGQFAFYATHQLFHSTHAVYLLVFDLSKPLEHLVKDDEYPGGAESAMKSMKDYIEFWVNSVHSFVASKDGKQPQIVLVGTHTDKLRDVKEEAKVYFEAVRQLFDGSILQMHLHPKTFEISGTDLSDKAIQLLRKTIFDIGRASNQNIPARWIPLEKALTEIRDENIIQFKRLQEIDGSSKYPIKNEEQLKFFLEFHHAKGTFLYFDDSKLTQFVVLNPQYIIDAFKCIMTSREFCITDGTLRPLWQQLTKDAILRPELIQGVWDNGTDNRFSKFKDVLVLFLQKLRIIAEAQMFDIESLVPLGYYIVPSFLRKAEDDEIVTFLKGRTCTTVSVVYAFENEAIVPTIFQRVMASAIGTWPVVKNSDRSLHFENACVFKLDLSYAGIILRHRKMIELSMAHLCLGENVFADKPDYFRRFVEYVIGTEFGKLQRNGDGLEKTLFQTGIRCFHEIHEYAGSKEIYYLDDLKPLSSKSVSCPDDVFHEGIRIEQIFQQWFFKEEETLPTKKKIPQRKLSSKEYVKLSCDCIGSEWKILARQLEIGEVRIDHIESDNQKMKNRIYEMLLEWDTKDGDRATLDVLVKALGDISSPAVNSDTLKNIIDSFYCQ